VKRAFFPTAFTVLLALSATAAVVEKTQGVYVTLLSGLKADVGETAAKAESALEGAGFAVLASFENGVPRYGEVRRFRSFIPNCAEVKGSAPRSAAGS
jgi:hypothetical protein